MIQLGQKVKDKITGFTGIATAKTEYLNGCLQVLVQPKMVVKKGGKQEYPEGKWIDIEQVDVVDGGKKVKTNLRPEPSGGVRQHPV